MRIAADAPRQNRLSNRRVPPRSQNLTFEEPMNYRGTPLKCQTGHRLALPMKRLILELKSAAAFLVLIGQYDQNQGAETHARGGGHDHTIGFAIFLAFLVFIGIFLVAALLELLFPSPRRTTSEPQLVDQSQQPQARVMDVARSWALLVPNGRETFFPRAPHQDTVYEITISGVVRRSHDSADAMYSTTRTAIIAITPVGCWSTDWNYGAIPTTLYRATGVNIATPSTLMILARGSRSRLPHGSPGTALSWRRS